MEIFLSYDKSVYFYLGLSYKVKSAINKIRTLSDGFKFGKLIVFITSEKRSEDFKTFPVSETCEANFYYVNPN